MALQEVLLMSRLLLSSNEEEQDNDDNNTTSNNIRQQIKLSKGDYILFCLMRLGKTNVQQLLLIKAKFIELDWNKNGLVSMGDLAQVMVLFPLLLLLFTDLLLLC